VQAIRPAPALLAFGALLIPAALALVVVTTVVDRTEPPVPDGAVGTGPDGIPRPTEEPVAGPVAHVNSVGDYAFSYPRTWAADEAGGVTRVENPRGDIVVSFGPGAPGDIAAASGRLVSSILGIGGGDLGASEALTGSSWDRIDGARSFIVSGVTEDPAGRSMRFLAITVRAAPRNFAISVLVPAASDPTRVLPRIEAIVSSFEILEQGASVAA
jgi:hypothetical protein